MARASNNGLRTPAPKSTVERTVEAVWRMESGKIIGKLARMLQNVGQAEEFAQDSLVAALEQWPSSGVPDNAGAWLMTTAKNRALDELRRRKVADRTLGALAHESTLAAPRDTTPSEAADDEIGDDFLRLTFIACHPVLSPEARAALTLRLLAGLTTPEIARAFLVPEPTIGQRIVRAKRTLTEAHIPFEAPSAAERVARLGSVLEVIYLIFNEGYAATTGDDWVRPALCEDALRLGRILAELMPHEAELHGLVALMEIHASRLGARTDLAGNPILLYEQNRGRWDQVLIQRGLAALERSQNLGGALGPYALQAAIAACHARARTAAETDWPRIVALYDALAQVTPSPVIELNRAVAISMAFGPEEALQIVESLALDERLAAYHWLPSVHGDLLERLGRFEEARREFSRAAALTGNSRESALLLGRAATCGSAAGDGRRRS